VSIWLWVLVGLAGAYLLGAIITVFFTYDRVYRPFGQCFLLWWLALAGVLYGLGCEWWDDRRLKHWQKHERRKMMKLELRFCKTCGRSTIQTKTKRPFQTGYSSIVEEREEGWYCPNCGNWEEQSHTENKVGG